MRNYIAPYNRKPVSIEAPQYTEEEGRYRSFLIKRMTKTFNERESSLIEFDDMSYSTYFEQNILADQAYLMARKNPEDTRIVTGTTRQKGKTLASSLLNYNLEANIVAYDNNNSEVIELGTLMEDMIRKSREIEKYDDKRLLYYKEGLQQGTWFVEELWSEKLFPQKDFSKIDFTTKVSSGQIDWKTKVEMYHEGCETRLISGNNVYLGNIREFAIGDQPYVFTVDNIFYDEAEMIYHDWDRWKNVPRAIQNFSEISDVEYRNWTFLNDNNDKVEVIRYYDKFHNEFMLILNGVMMLPIGFPLEKISPSREYPIAKGDIDPISQFFAYSKSIPADTKTDQQVLDEMIRLLLLKTQQSLRPPMVNNTNRVLSRNIFMPGVITSGINPAQLTPLITAQGVSTPEFQMFQLIRDIVNEKSTSPVFSGDALPGKQTATEIIELKKQQMMKLGTIIWGVVNFEKQLAYLRTFNILNNWTNPVDKKVDRLKNKLVDVYKTIEVNGQDENGKDVQKIIEMNEEKANSLNGEQVKAREDMVSKVRNKSVRKYYVDPKKLKESMKYNFYITVNPTEKNSSELEAVLFKKNVADAVTIFGIQSVNMDYLKKRWAVVNKEDPEQFFLRTPQMMPPMGGMPQNGMPSVGGNIENAMMKGITGSKGTEPSLNTLMGQAK